MKKLKNLIIGILLLSITYTLPHFVLADFSLSEEFPYNGVEINPGSVETDFKNILKDDIEEGNNGLNQILTKFMPDNTLYDEGNGPSFIFYLKTIVNLLLSFVSLVALILVIYAFYMIFFKKDEAGITSARQIIKGVIIALFIIGLSRVIVTFLYRFEKEQTTDIGYNNNFQVTNTLT